MKKEEAKQKAIEETTKALQKYIDENTVEKESDEDFDNDSDDDSHYGNSNNGPDTYDKKNLEKFLESLKFNWTCDAGFYDSGKKLFVVTAHVQNIIKNGRKNTRYLFYHMKNVRHRHLRLQMP